jgi:hypothetical protein
MLKVTSPLAATRVASDAIEETNRPGCQEWREMLRAYPAAMQQYCQAVMSLMALDAATFNEPSRRARCAKITGKNYFIIGMSTVVLLPAARERCAAIILNPLRDILR